MRYFGSKEKLFAAAADFDLRLPDLRALPRDRIGAALVEHFVERWEADDTFMALIRAAVTNEAAAKQVRAVLGGTGGARDRGALGRSGEGGPAGRDSSPARSWGWRFAGTCCDCRRWWR